MHHLYHVLAKTKALRPLVKKSERYSYLSIGAGLIASMLTLGTSSAMPVPTFLKSDSTQDVQKIIRFLTSSLEENGITYVGTAGGLDKKRLPLSYYCTREYWENYVLAPDKDGVINMPAFTDRYVPGKPFLEPVEGPAGDLQVERVNIHNGCNIYDGATWQIALALAGHEGMKSAHGEDLFDLANNESCMLKLGYDGNCADPEETLVEGQNRGMSGDATQPKFLYNDCFVNNSNQAYFFRQVSRTYAVDDPVKSKGLIQVQDLPDHTTYPKICISWCDWKPITGENVWAFLIGPLQSALIRYQAQPCVPFDSLAVQNALAILTTFQKMQSKTGGIYYAPEAFAPDGTKSSESPYKISVENNMSALAGLLVFKKVLQQEVGSPYLSVEKRNKIAQALNVIQTMIYGGTHVFDDNGVEKIGETAGLLAFLREKAWDPERKEFILGGEANNPANQEDWVATQNSKNQGGPNNGPSRAVDVNTWGVAVLGQPFIDGAFGFGSCYNLWQNVKCWGGYYGSDRELWGVGYSDLDGNGEIPLDPNGSRGVMSGEWTFGAINMLRVLITQYSKVANSVEETLQNRNNAHRWVTELQRDHDSMIRHIQSLRTDHYAQEKDFKAVRPPKYDSLIFIPTDKMGYLYANKRYLIPFGWNANPIPSMASTTWAVMLHYNFNPFSADGTYAPNEL